MDHFAGLDVSVKDTSVCIVDDTGIIDRDTVAAGDAMLKRKKFTQRKKFTPRADRPKEEQAKERERMAEALAAHQGPITKCPPGSVRALSASGRVAKRPSRSS
jgi:hypothetical protein